MLPAPPGGWGVGGRGRRAHRRASSSSHRPAGPREPPAPRVEIFTFDLQEPLSKERVEGFSDGVYAIVATLLILDIW